MRSSYLTTVLLFLLSTPFLFCQTRTLADVHLFQSFFRDAPIAPVPYGEAGFGFRSFDAFSSINLGVRGGYPFTPKFELDAGLDFINTNPDNNGEGESGLSDLFVLGKYKVYEQTTKITAGGYITLPIGSEKLGQENFNFGAFGALRHPLQTKTALTAALGLDFLEFGDDREFSILLAGGLVQQLNNQVNLVGELKIETERDYAMLSGGIDFELNSAGQLRGALGLGLDDGAPDIALLASYLLAFK